jgi:hypothetical protein
MVKIQGGLEQESKGKVMPAVLEFAVMLHGFAGGLEIVGTLFAVWWGGSRTSARYVAIILGSSL